MGLKKILGLMLVIAEILITSTIFGTLTLKGFPFIFTFMSTLIGILMGVLLLILYSFLIAGKSEIKISNATVNFLLHCFSFDFLLFPIICSLCVIAVLSFSSLNYKLFIPWLQIPAINWFRFMVTSILMTFIPGYFFLSLCKREEQVSTLEEFSMSFLLSILFWGLSGFIGLLFGYKLNDISIFLILCVSFTSFPISMFIYRKNQSKHLLHNYLISYSTICLIIVIIILASLIYMGVSVNGLYWGDEPFHFGNSLVFEKGFPTLRKERFCGYPWFSHLYLAFYYTISGFPPENIYLILHIIGISQVIPFYLLAKTFTENKAIQLLSTLIYSLFAGFGWIYVVYQNYFVSSPGMEKIINLIDAAGLKTYDIWITASGTHLALIMPYFIGMSSFIMLLYIIRRSWKSCFLPSFLTISFTVLGFLVHKYEVLIFALLLSLILVFSCDSLFFKKKLAISTIIGFIIVAIIDFFSPGRVYTIDAHGNLFCDELYPGLLVLLLLCIVFLHIGKLRVALVVLVNFFRSIIRKVRFLILTGVVALYFSAILVYFYSFNQTTLTREWIFQTGVVPWYYYPIRLGIAGFLALISFLHYAWGKKNLLKNYNFIAGLLIFVLLISKGAYPIQFVLPSIAKKLRVSLPLEARLTPFLWIPLSLMSAEVAFKVLSSRKKIYLSLKTKVPRKVHLPFRSFFLIFLLTTGTGSILLQAEYISLVGYGSRIFFTTDVTAIEKEKEALEFIRSISSLNDSIATVTHLSRDILITYCGVIPERVFSFTLGTRYPSMPWTDILFNSTDPEIVLDLISCYDIRYVYVANRDVEESLKYEKSYFFNHLINYLPIIFKNAQVTIYSIPRFVFSDQPKLAVVTSSTGILELAEPFSDKNFQLGWSDNDFSSGWKIADTSNTIHNFSLNLNNGLLLMEGIFTTERDYVWLEKNISVDAEEYPLIVLRAKTSANILNVRFFSPNEELLPGYNWFASPGYYGKSVGTNEKWQTIIFDIDPRVKSISKIQIMFDDIGSANEIVGYQYLIVNAIAVADSLPLDSSKYFPIEMAALANVSYTTFSDIDKTRFNYKYIMLADDREDLQINDYLSWVYAGGSLVILKNNNRGKFGDMFSLFEGSQNVIADGIGGRTSIQFPELFTFTTLYSTDPYVSILAHYTYKGEPVCPFAFFKHYGRGKIILLNIKPYFQELSVNKGKDKARSMHGFLGKVLQIAEIEASCDFPEEPAYFPELHLIVGKNACLVGNTGFQSDFLYLQNGIQLEYLRINSEIIDMAQISRLAVHGSCKVTTKSKFIIKNGVSRYIFLQCNEFCSMKIELLEDAKAELSLPFKQSEKVITLGQYSTIEFLGFANESSMITLVIGAPTTITNEGTLHFDQYYSVYPFNPSDITGDGKQISIIGTSTFHLRYGDDRYVFISDLLCIQK